MSDGSEGELSIHDLSYYDSGSHSMPVFFCQSWISHLVVSKPGQFMRRCDFDRVLTSRINGRVAGESGGIDITRLKFRIKHGDLYLAYQPGISKMVLQQ